MNSIKITLDTNLVDDANLLEIARGIGCDIAVVTVTEREVEGTRFSVHLDPIDRVPELGVYGEAHYSRAVYTSGLSSQILDAILRILSSRSFPNSRATLTAGERRQLRDALILEAHIRDGRDVFVTNDTTGFIHHGKRTMLEAAFSVRILTGQEFIDACRSGSSVPAAV